MIISIWAFCPNTVLTNIVRLCDKIRLRERVDPNDLIIGKEIK
jgi:hypothetical protein